LLGGIHELDEVSPVFLEPSILFGRSPSTVMRETVPAASFRIVYLQRRKSDREGGKP